MATTQAVIANLPFCRQARRRLEQRAGQELARETGQAARMSRWREIIFGAQDGVVSTLAVVIAMSEAQDAILLTMTAGIAGALAGIASMATGAWLGSRAEEDVRAARRPPPKTGRRGNSPPWSGPSWKFCSKNKGIRPPPLAPKPPGPPAGHSGQTLLELEYGIAMTNAGSPWQDALTMGAAFGIASMAPLVAAAGGAYAGVNPAVAATAASIGTLTLLGWIKARAVGKPWLGQCLEILAAGSISGGAGWIIGKVAEQLGAVCAG